MRRDGVDALRFEPKERAAEIGESSFSLKPICISFFRSLSPSSLPSSFQSFLPRFLALRSLFPIDLSKNELFKFPARFNVIEILNCGRGCGFDFLTIFYVVRKFRFRTEPDAVQLSTVGDSIPVLCNVCM
ncbi:hypothetical protein VNO78_05532 [Psophocarpus tetragonolobus]|uniref:Uncharacterized protein n=1 Tax=Psophocarpus tetragonolobus TaxID=3891 RepID=A0AAN9STT2_PSOTE